LGIFAIYLLFRAGRQHLTLENGAVTVLVHKGGVQCGECRASRRWSSSRRSSSWSRWRCGWPC